ncbi:MAG: WHy domain-containing protein [Nitrospira sp.]|nr:MAG: WHy domain-containing protein [Nitrospira sp.]
MGISKLLLFMVILAALSGCASWFTTGERPDVLVANITPLDSTPFEQRLKIDLRVRNPNDSELHVTGMDIKLDLNGKRLARGLGNQAFTVPRLSDTVVAIETTTSTLDVVRQVLGLRNAQALNYEISGVLHVKDGRLPFENSGVLVEKGELSGILAP